MRHKSRLPGFLFSFPHAVAFKGGGAPAMPAVPTYTPPANGGAANRPYSAFIQGEIASGRQSGYYDSSWTDEAIANNIVSNGYAKDLYTNPEGWVDPTMPTPPAPDAPVTSPNGQTVTAPTPYQAPPPVSDRSSEVMQAGRAARQASKRRKGLLSTYLAGETGGAKGAAPSLLGRSNLP